MQMATGFASADVSLFHKNYSQFGKPSVDCRPQDALAMVNWLLSTTGTFLMKGLIGVSVAMLSLVVAWRRAIHQNPELDFQAVRTDKPVADR